MCGIVGSYSNGNHESQEKRIQEAVNALKHRGPDDKGIEKYLLNDSSLILGHTRLAIIDLSSSGHQPMNSFSGRYSLIFNGEIYNYIEIREELIALGYTFQTNTDTEVLLSAWEEWNDDSLKRLKGMFSFVIFDKKKKILSGARDAFGIKPFFYFHDDEEFIFSSEISALLKACKKTVKPNWQVAYDYLVKGHYDNSENTFFDNVKNLLPGHSFLIDLNTQNKLIIKKWWFPSIEEKTDLTFKKATEELRELFLENIRLHLRSDVPVGAALSGGIDSSAVVCAIRHLEPSIDINTFSFVARGSNVNEENWIDIVNSEINAIENKIVISPDDLSRDIDDLIKCQGEPFASTSIYAQYRVFKEARDKGITVTLDGQGADELLAGYNGYPDSRLISILNQNGSKDALMFIKRYCDFNNKSFKDILFPFISKKMNINLKNQFKKLSNTEPPSWIDKSWCNEKNITTTSSFDWNALIRQDPTRVLSNTLRHAITGTNGLVHLLRHEDRNAMNWSIESRVPFLTTDLAEYVLSLPENYLMSNEGKTKSIFREAMKDIVPDLVLNRKDKIGFETPEDKWIQDFILKESSKSFTDAISIFNEERMIQLFKNPKPLPEKWRIINYKKWYESFF
jgi:asparagine synthase (glutamine-hydrolysing)